MSINSLRVHVQYVYVLLILCIGIELGFYIFICMFLYTLLFFFALVFLPLTTVQARCAKKRFFLASICHANTDPPVTKIRLWASFDFWGVAVDHHYKLASPRTKKKLASICHAI